MDEATEYKPYSQLKDLSTISRRLQNLTNACLVTTDHPKIKRKHHSKRGVN